MTEARLQFRWEPGDDAMDEFGARNWICKYELLIALDEHDIRREDENGNKVHDFQVLEIGRTTRGSALEPCRTEAGDYFFDAPYRDGAHAVWDASKLGDLPIVSIAVDGTVVPKSAEPPRPIVEGPRA